MVLEDRMALVSGASKGIGRATLVVLARCGAATAMAGRAADGTAQDVQAELAAFGGVSDIFPCDLSKAGAPEPLVTDVVERFGRLDILVRMAGLAIPEPLAEISHESIVAQVSVNLAAPILLIQAARAIAEILGFGRITPPRPVLPLDQACRGRVEDALRPVRDAV